MYVYIYIYKYLYTYTYISMTYHTSHIVTCHLYADDSCLVCPHRDTHKIQYV